MWIQKWKNRKIIEKISEIKSQFFENTKKIEKTLAILTKKRKDSQLLKLGMKEEDFTTDLTEIKKDYKALRKAQVKVTSWWIIPNINRRGKYYPFTSSSKNRRGRHTFQPILWGQYFPDTKARQWHHKKKNFISVSPGFWREAKLT